MSDEMDLIVEQVKMLGGDIAFSTSTLKRLMEQFVNDPHASKTQIQSLECEIEEKRNQMRLLEQRIIQNGEASMTSASLIDMQQLVARLNVDCSQKDFELEIKTADNRILQELEDKVDNENKVLREQIHALERQLASVRGEKLSFASEKAMTDEYIEELKKKVQLQSLRNESSLGDNPI